MWLDRLSGPSTPSSSPSPAQKRSYSPAPGRSSHLAPTTATRPPYGPRTSSLGLGSRLNNNSTTSLNSPRLPNGSSLRQQIVPHAEVADPLDVLEGVIGKKSKHAVNGHIDEHSPTSQKPPQLVEDVDFDGLSLHAFAEGADQEETERSPPLTIQTTEECEYVYPLPHCIPTVKTK